MRSIFRRIYSVLFRAVLTAKAVFPACPTETVPHQGNRFYFWNPFAGVYNYCFDSSVNPNVANGLVQGMINLNNSTAYLPRTLALSQTTDPNNCSLKCVAGPGESILGPDFVATTHRDYQDYLGYIGHATVTLWMGSSGFDSVFDPQGFLNFMTKLAVHETGNRLECTTRDMTARSPAAVR